MVPEQVAAADGPAVTDPDTTGPIPVVGSSFPPSVPAAGAESAGAADGRASATAGPDTTASVPVAVGAAAGAGAAAGGAGEAGSSGSPGGLRGAAGRAADSVRSRAKVVPRPGRRVKLTVARVDPWSVMKLSFLLSVAGGIAFVILTAALWLIGSGMGLFDSIQGLLDSLQTNSPNPIKIQDFVGFPRVMALSVVLGVFDVLLMTAVATVSAFIYNICSALVGGVELTLTDD